MSNGISKQHHLYIIVNVRRNYKYVEQIKVQLINACSSMTLRQLACSVLLLRGKDNILEKQVKLKNIKRRQKVDSTDLRKL